MLDRTKLKRIGLKHQREVIDNDYAELLIGKCILLGAKWRSGDGSTPGVTHRLVVGLSPPHEVGFGVPQRWVVWRRPKEEFWTVNTKMMHDFLMWHAGGKYET